MVEVFGMRLPRNYCDFRVRMVEGNEGLDYQTIILVTGIYLQSLIHGTNGNL
jgi:hypothetical protein